MPHIMGIAIWNMRFHAKECSFKQESCTGKHGLGELKKGESSTTNVLSLFSFVAIVLGKSSVLALSYLAVTMATV